MCKANFETITHIIKYPKLLQKNRNEDMTGWERLCIGLFVERKALMLQRNGMNTNVHLIQQISLLKLSGTLTFKRTI